MGDPISTGQWQRSFAWWPVRTFDGVWLWLRPIAWRQIIAGRAYHWRQYARITHWRSAP